tara:strand:- start:54 stop:1112 length:1059 start_codon:yes stop_codon:yes gene_type:complete
MIDLNSTQVSNLADRFPQFELSYETISHTKVSSTYNVVTAIPTGKKVFLWFTFYQNKDVCYLFELNKDKRISKGKLLDMRFPTSLSLGTVLYGSCINDENDVLKAVVVDDILYYQGVILNNTSFIHKLSMIKKTCSQITKQDVNSPIYSTVFWEITINDSYTEYPNTISSEIFETIPYNIHHIQYRCAYEKRPFVNVFMNKKLNVVNLPAQVKKTVNPLENMLLIPYRMSQHKTQYRYPTIFQVMADIQFDIYHLFIYGKNNQRVYYNLACIPDYKTSVFMNSLFRKIRENDNLDYIEESDNEEDFQNIDEDKYVDVNKVLYIECNFHRKFKKWVPDRVVSRREKIAHVSQL